MHKTYQFCFKIINFGYLIIKTFNFNKNVKLKKKKL